MLSPQIPSPMSRPPSSLGAGGFFIPGSGMPGTNEYPSTYYPSQDGQQYPPQSPGLSSPNAGGFVMPGSPMTPGPQPILYPPFMPGNQPNLYGSASAVSQLHDFNTVPAIGDSDYAESVKNIGGRVPSNASSTVVSNFTSSQPGRESVLTTAIYTACVLNIWILLQNEFLILPRQLVQQLHLHRHPLQSLV